ncbi:MAG TPA: ribosome silencing factor [Pseudomonadales bacterium]|nr:ribosome silencing factor [Pseudomonadales bacterium]
MSLTPEQLAEIVHEALDELKAKDIVQLDVRPMTSMADIMLVATGTSNRHVRSLADNIREKVKEKTGRLPVGMEGMDSGEWVLVDLGEVIAHIMQPAARQFYDLEKLWSVSPNQASNKSA